MPAIYLPALEGITQLFGVSAAAIYLRFGTLSVSPHGCDLALKLEHCIRPAYQLSLIETILEPPRRSLRDLQRLADVLQPSQLD